MFVTVRELGGNFLEQLPLVVGFGQDVLCGIHIGIKILVKPAGELDLDTGIKRRYQSRQFLAIQFAWHNDVGKNQIKRFKFNRFQCAFRIFHCLNGVTCSREHPDSIIANPVFILHDQDSFC
jgi:hypothetical protein